MGHGSALRLRQRTGRAAVAFWLGLSIASPVTSGVTGDADPKSDKSVRLMRIVLSDVQQVEAVPPDILSESAFGPIPIRKDVIGRRAEFYERAATRERLARPIDATCTVSYYDESKNVYLMAGYEYLTERGKQRQKSAYLAVVKDNDPPLACDFRLAGTYDEELTLREVLAVDSQRVYLQADRNTGESIVISARYAFEAVEED